MMVNFLLDLLRTVCHAVVSEATRSLVKDSLTKKDEEKTVQHARKRKDGSSKK